MNNFSDKSFIGKRYGRWLIISYLGKYNRKSVFLCKCDCGNLRVVVSSNLQNGASRSCGCLKNKLLLERITTHNKSKIDGKISPLYEAWCGIKKRCYNSNSKSYYNYGGRGIFVCRRWRKDFLNFYKDMGPKPTPKHSVDRIDNNGPYAPWNCRWATMIEQANNRRSRIKELMFTYKGRTKSLYEWSEIIDIKYDILFYRYTRGWDEDRIFTAVGKYNKDNKKI